MKSYAALTGSCALSRDISVRPIIHQSLIQLLSTRSFAPDCIAGRGERCGCLAAISMVSKTLVQTMVADQWPDRRLRRRNEPGGQRWTLAHGNLVGLGSILTLTLSVS